MAEKMKAEKKNRVVEYLLSEHKLENYLLLFLGLFAIELGVILLQGKLLTIPEEAWLIGGKTNTIVFSWVLIGLGAISIVLVASSFYRPSFTEIRHITGLKWKEFLWNVVKVVLFSVVLALFFIGCDWVIEKIIQLLKNTAGFLTCVMTIPTLIKKMTSMSKAYTRIFCGWARYRTKCFTARTILSSATSTLSS